MVSAFSFGLRQNEQKKEADKAAEVEKAEFFCEINTKKSEKILELGWKRKNIGVGLDIKGKSIYNRIVKICRIM